MQGPINVQLQRLEGSEDLPLPGYMSEYAAGMDLYAGVCEAVVLEPMKRALVPCGFKMALPDGYEAQVRPRSGLALKHGLILPNAPGTIDADYRGEVCVILANLSDESFTIQRAMRIAQMVIAPVSRVRLDVVASLPDSVRGDGGFGHTGV
jgi:dUTP pyrophosphatase